MGALRTWLATRPTFVRRAMVTASLSYCGYSLWTAVDRGLSVWMLETYRQPAAAFFGGAIALAAYVVGSLFVHRRKRLVLFLRKFHNPEATALMRAAVSQRQFAAFRLVTLDDGQFSPRGAPVTTIVGTLALSAFGIAIVLISILFVLVIYAEEFGQFYWMPATVAVVCGFMIPCGGIGFVTIATGLVGAYSILRTRTMKTRTVHDVMWVWWPGDSRCSNPERGLRTRSGRARAS